MRSGVHQMTGSEAMHRTPFVNSATRSAKHGAMHGAMHVAMHGAMHSAMHGAMHGAMRAQGCAGAPRPPIRARWLRGQALLLGLAGSGGGGRSTDRSLGACRRRTPRGHGRDRGESRRDASLRTVQIGAEGLGVCRRHPRGCFLKKKPRSADSFSPSRCAMRMSGPRRSFARPAVTA